VVESTEAPAALSREPLGTLGAPVETGGDILGRTIEPEERPRRNGRRKRRYRWDAWQARWR
jgi:hypothetical protein